MSRMKWKPIYFYFHRVSAQETLKIDDKISKTWFS